MIDEAGDVRRAEPIVDVDDGDVRCAAVEHAEQRGNAIEAGAISDAGWDGNYGHGYESAHHAGQSPLHTGDNNQHSSAIQLVVPVEQPVMRARLVVMRAV